MFRLSPQSSRSPLSPLSLCALRPPGVVFSQTVGQVGQVQVAPALTDSHRAAPARL
jgi:hypothetical protein